MVSGYLDFKKFIQSLFTIPNNNSEPKKCGSVFAQNTKAKAGSRLPRIHHTHMNSLSHKIKVSTYARKTSNINIKRFF